ncbi:MAG: response regulator [Syntrophobacteraceae bacterium]|jgi:PAS domain S-box-containing protein|nr:response regulator [Syntrophobacteraceae bacterium]
MEEPWKVLVIDDDPGIRKVTALALEDAGYRVITAPDGESGIELFKEEHPHIVITDVGMPGMDGLEVLRRIKEIDPDREVIVTTAFTEIALAIRAMQLDASGFVTKPASDAALSGALGRARDRYLKRRDLQSYTALLEERWMDTAEELARMFQFQRLLIESSIDGVVACDRRGKVVLFNRSAEELLGHSRAEVVGTKSLMELFPNVEAGRFQDELYRTDDDSQPARLYPFESRMLCRDGSSIDVLLSATVLFEEKEQTGIVVYFRKLEPEERS